MGELGVGIGERKPVEEAADDEDGAADREEEGYQERDVVPGEGGEHAADAFEDGLGRRSWWREVGSYLFCVCWYDEGMSA